MLVMGITILYKDPCIVRDAAHVPFKLQEGELSNKQNCE